MSNEVLNVHIRFGEPCGEGKDLETIANWAGEMITDLSQRLDAVYESAVELMIPYATIRTDVLRDLKRLRHSIDVLIDETTLRLDRKDGER